MKTVRESPTCCFHDRHKCSSSNDEGRTGTGFTGKMATQNTYTGISGRSSPAKVILPARASDSNAAFTLIYSSSSSKRLTQSSLQQYFTKGYYNLINYFTSAPPFKLDSQISIFSVTKSRLSRLFALVAFCLVISLSSFSPTSAVLLSKQLKCETHGWNAFPVWKYRAKARWVPPMRTDRRMQQEFLQLFRGGDRYDKDSSSSEEESWEDYPLDIGQLKRIADMCPKNAFFYSLSPKHIEAANEVARMLTAVPSPPEVLRLAKALLRSPYVNPKVWYYGIIGAAQERPDMTGYTIAHIVDAMPDLFVPGPMLFELMKKYKSALIARMGAVNGTSSTSVHREKRSVRKDRQAQQKKVNFNGAKNRQGRKAANETFTQTLFKQIEIGLGYNGVNKDNRTNSIKSKNTNGENKQERKDQLKVSKSGKKGKRRKMSKKRDSLPGNVTEYEAESSMWKRARIDAFDDCIVIDGSVGLRNGIENKLWYFREDMMVNQHHWYWHQEYPLNSTRHRPRRAELFFYMHRNLIARYNAERISNGLPLVVPFDIRPGAPIDTAYDSQLADINSGKFWTARPHGVHLTDIIHEMDPDFERNILIGQYNQLYGRLVRSIKVGELLVGNIKTLKIRNTKGIEPLGNTVEASELSVNPQFYDMMGFHNLGHQIIGLATDPKFEAEAPVGVMADTATTMRDPEFYSYHVVVDNIFDLYKKTLPPYQPRGGEYPLVWEGVEVLNVEVISKHGGKSRNQLRTFWANKRYELAPGVDRSIHQGDLEVDVCAVHLNHEPFDFKITVSLDPCAHTKSNKGSVRIFLAPRYDEHGNRFPLKIQRRLMIHMDTFPVDLRVGKNVIYRRSFDSNLLTPWTKHLKQYENPPKNPQSADYCGCGWPTHLYIPKGSNEGTHFDLFVMLTNFDDDYVEDNPDDLLIPERCNSPYLYCGIKWRQYPDAKPMGYPFDRLPFAAPIQCPPIKAGPLWSLLLCRFLQLFWYRQVNSLEEYVSYTPNMASTVVEVRHFDQLVW